MTARALAALGYWDEMKRLGSMSASWGDAQFVWAAVADPSMGVVEVMDKARPELREELLESAAGRRPAEAGLLVAYARDHGLFVGPALLAGAGSDLVKSGRWGDLLELLKDHSESAKRVEMGSACEWVFKCKKGLQRDLMEVLGEREGRLLGALAAAELVEDREKRQWEATLMQASDKHMAAVRCFKTLADFGPVESAGMVALMEWIVAQAIGIEPKVVGFACLRLAKVKDLDGIQKLVKLVEQPDATCLGALINCLAEMNDFEGALRVIDRVVEAGIKPPFDLFRLLLLRMEDRPEVLEVFALAHRIVERVDTAGYNQCIKCLLKFGKWREALELTERYIRYPDVFTYMYLITGLSNLGRGDEALHAAELMMADLHIVANEYTFTAMRSLCRAYGFERSWPAMRAWCAKHGVAVGLMDTAWRDAKLDPISDNPARLLHFKY